MLKIESNLLNHLFDLCSLYLIWIYILSCLPLAIATMFSIIFVDFIANFFTILQIFLKFLKNIENFNHISHFYLQNY